MAAGQSQRQSRGRDARGHPHDRVLNTFVSVIVSREKLAEAAKDRVLSATVNGDAEPSYLAKDQCVSFTAEITGGTTGTGEVDEVTIFTPNSSHPLEMMDTKPDMDDSDSAKKPTNRTSTYMIAGQVQSFRDGQLIVKVPNERGRTLQIKVRLADNAVVKVHATDLSLARPGDLIDVDGFTGDPAGQVGSLVAERVAITATKPFMNAKRAKALAAAKAAAQLAAEQKQRKPRGGKNTADNEMDADDAVAAEMAEPAAPDEPVANPAAPGKPATKAVSLRQPGDPPAEGIIFVDAFSVDEAKPGGAGLTALHIAARHGQAAVVDLLLESGAQAEARTKSGVTPLMVAAWRGQPKIVKALLEKGVQVATADNEGQTALMYAAASGNADVVQLLLDHNALANAKSKRGTTPLSVVARGQRAERRGEAAKSGQGNGPLARQLRLIAPRQQIAPAAIARSCAAPAADQRLVPADLTGASGAAVCRSGFAPASRSIFTIGALPFLAADISGVSPSASAELGLALAASSILTRSGRFLMTASRSAVRPSLSLAVRSAPSLISFCTVAAAPSCSIDSSRPAALPPFRGLTAALVGPLVGAVAGVVAGSSSSSKVEWSSAGGCVVSGSVVGLPVATGSSGTASAGAEGGVGLLLATLAASSPRLWNTAQTMPTASNTPSRIRPTTSGDTCFFLRRFPLAPGSGAAAAAAAVLCAGFAGRFFVTARDATCRSASDRAGS